MLGLSLLKEVAGIIFLSPLVACKVKLLRIKACHFKRQKKTVFDSRKTDFDFVQYVETNSVVDFCRTLGNTEGFDEFVIDP